MAGAFRRATDKARGKSGKWTGWFISSDGRKRQFAGTTDKGTTLDLARKKEAEAHQVRAGLIDPGEIARQDAAHLHVSAHVESYRLGLVARGGTPKHCKHVAGVLARLLREAAIGSVADLSPERIGGALGRMAAAGRSPRTCNHALGAVKAFARWLADNNRIREVPRGLRSIGPANESVGRKRVRRAATMSEIDRLLAAAESGPTVHVYGPTKSKHHKVAITGPERAALYRLALGTGFRAKELRALVPEWFDLDGPEPRITIPAEHTKNGKPAPQPITRELAAGLRAFLATREPGRPVIVVPDRSAQMLRVDLEAAGIPYHTKDGTLDFHALRGSYITHLVRSGANPRVVQKLARHSTVTLTLERYTHTDDDDLRKALEGEK